MNMNKMTVTLLLLCWMVGSGNAEAGIGYGKGGPNRYAKAVLLDLSSVVARVDRFIQTDNVHQIDFARIEKDLEDVCAGKCSEENLARMTTVVEDKEHVRLIRETIYRQILRILQEIRESKNAQSLKDWDQIVMKLKKMRLELLGTGSSTMTGSVVIRRAQL